MNANLETITAFFQFMIRKSIVPRKPFISYSNLNVCVREGQGGQLPKMMGEGRLNFTPLEDKTNLVLYLSTIF